MRILHISHGGMPDPRIEKMAMTLNKRGHETMFLGGGPIRGQEYGAFSEASTIPLASGPRIAYDSRVKRRWIQAIREKRADIIHAHNIDVGHFLLDLDIPAVFDDHERMSSQTFKLDVRSPFRRFASRIYFREFAGWEKDLALRFPVITVSPGIVSYYKQFTDRVYLALNMPMLRDVESLKSPSDRSGIVYVGYDFNYPRFVPHRDMTGLREILSFDVVCGLPHHEMMERLTHYRIGLTPYRPHPIHVQANPNRNYEYLHAGLQVVLQKTLDHLFRGVPYVHTFSGYDEIKHVVDSVPDVDPREIMSFAAEHYIWENQEEQIVEAYRAAGVNP